ncbi:MAG: hypothetical protein HY328_04840 [Chloroflexi bacterium]|nr:hypothetical protein [Chloroflexota bacterium]
MNTKTRSAHFQSRYEHRVSLSLLIVGLLVLLLQPVLLFAQSNVSSPWKTYRREDGLASNNVLSILPGNGEIWFGTDAGISRFNGEWTTFTPAENPFAGKVNLLVADPTTGKLWAGTAEGDIVFWDGSVWTNVLKVPSSVNALLPVGGQLWIGSDSGLYIWVESAAVPVDFLQGVRVQALASQGNAVWVGTAQGLWIHQRDTWTAVTADNVLPWEQVSAIWADPSGPVWVAAEGNLAWREPSSGIWTPISTEVLQLTNPTPIVALTGDANGVVWGGTHGNGPFRVLDRRALVAFSGEGEIGLTTPFVQAVAIDNDGLVWFGTQSGVFRYDEKMWVKELADNVLYPGINRISAIESSVENQLWIGTANAGIRMKSIESDQPIERSYTTSTSNLPTNLISGLTRDLTGNIWAGTHIGVARYNSQTDNWESPVPLAALPSALVTALLAENEHLWIGTDSGLAQYNLNTGSVIIFPEVGKSHVKALAVDSLRRLWVGTLTDGLFVQEMDGSWVQHTSESDAGKGILAGAVVALAADPNTSGGVWVGVDLAGINYWDGREWHDLTNQARLPSKLLYRFYTDPVDGSLWIGSEGGVSRYDGRTWGTLVVENVLPSAAILAIGRSGNSYWFGGRDGLTYYQPERTKPWVRFDRVGGMPVAGHTGNIQIETGRDIFIDYVAGDLYTTNTDISVLFRLSGPEQIGVWQIVNGGGLVLSDLNTGVVNVELQVRDQAFNYSDVVRLSLDVIAPPAMIQLPFFAPIRQDYFVALVVTGLIALTGAAYSATEVSRNRRRAREAVSRGFNPFVSGEPVRREDMFFGRYDLLQRIVDTLHNNSIMIYGERRIGKTTLLYQLAARLREVNDTDFWFIPLYIDLEGTTEEGFFHFFIEEILNGVMTLPEANQELRPDLTGLLYYHTSDPDYSDREFSRDLRDVIERLGIYAAARHPLKQLRIILLLDEMDVMSDYSRIVQQRLRRIFMRDFAATLGAVVAGIQISKEWDRIESPWYNLFNEIELQPFNREQSVELLTEPIRGFYEYEPAALEYILEESDGKPYRLQQYALEAVNHMLADGRRQILLNDVEYAREHIARVGNDTQIGIAAANARNGTTRMDEVEVSEENELGPASQERSLEAKGEGTPLPRNRL